MKTPIFILLFLLTGLSYGQTYNFETDLPSTFQAEGDGLTSLSKLKSKEGKQSLLWEWTGSSVLSIKEKSAIEAANNGFPNGGGIVMWIYISQTQKTPLTFRFKDGSGNVQYQFEYHLLFKGWKTCWIGFRDMFTPQGTGTSKASIVSMEIASPQGSSSGAIFIDRFKMLSSGVSAVIDAQIQKAGRDVSVSEWQWENNLFDVPVPLSVTAKEKAGMDRIIENIQTAYKGIEIADRELKGILSNVQRWGMGVEGAEEVKPLVTPSDHQYNSATDYRFDDWMKLLDQLSRGWYVNKNPEAKQAFIKVLSWGFDQGFSMGSAMGGYGLFGYATRPLYPIVLSMKEPLREAGLLDETVQNMGFWSGSAETRLPFEPNTVDQVSDTWNILIIPRLASSLLYEKETEQLRALQCFFRWTSGSLYFRPGTVGGIKPDGTGFHHGGLYPAYSVPGYGSLGSILNFSNGTQFGFTQEAKETLKFGLISASNFCNKVHWGTLISGRHPLHATINAIGSGQTEAWGHLAKAFDPIDEELASHYLRIAPASVLKAELLQKGFEANENPSGFFPYNYACYGMLRNNNWTVGIKGFNKYIWGFETYTADNRFGRYQSYGAIQIMTGNEAESRWTQDGWDWNRLPGTTTIHLPLDKLNNPIAGGTQDKSSETFAGVGALQRKYGMFAMKLKELSRTNYSPSFVARKSAFCFDNKIVCLGTGISNANSSYPTETTIFQQNLTQTTESFLWKEEKITAYPYNHTEILNQATVLSDLTGNYYRIESGQKLCLAKQLQDSKTDKKMTATQGTFASAYIDHGFSPAEQEYEYMISIQPTPSEIETLSEKQYLVLQKNNNAHIVEDPKNKIVGYALFEIYSNNSDRFILSSSKEIIALVQYNTEHLLKMSVTDPNINVGSSGYTTFNPSVAITKTIMVKGDWKLKENHPNVKLSVSSDITSLSITMSDGLSVNFDLIDSQYNSLSEEASSFISMTTTKEEIVLSGTAAQISIYDIQGKNISSFYKEEGTVQIALPKGVYIVKAGSESRIQSEKVIL